MHNNIQELLIIDDDSCHNIICALVLKKMFRPLNIDILGFTDSEEAITYLSAKQPAPGKQSVIFLDINMPVFNGWDVLHKIEQLPLNVRNQLSIYLLTASPNNADRLRAHDCYLVKDYLEKPLSEHLPFIFEQVAEKVCMDKVKKVTEMV